MEQDGVISVECIEINDDPYNIIDVQNNSSFYNYSHQGDYTIGTTDTPVFNTFTVTSFFLPFLSL